MLPRPSQLAAQARSVTRGAWTQLFWRRDSIATIPQQLSAWAAERPNDPFLVFEGRTQTVAEVDAAVDRHAAAYAALGVGHGDVAALCLHNRPALLLHLYGLGRLGAIGALVNPNLRGDTLAGAIARAKPRVVVAGDQTAAAVSELPRLPATAFIDREDDRPPSDRLRPWEEALRLGDAASGRTATGAARLDDVLAYIYTSGTTGLPKPALVKHHRFVRVGAGLAAVLRTTSEDCVYCCLPLYHANAVVLAASIAVTSRCRLALARRFSASRFWDECAETGATTFVYIGELGRYLHNTAAGPHDRAHRVSRIFGNGMRGELWPPFRDRFGISRIHEFYGSTEGNAETCNVLGVAGSCGPMLPGRMALARYDVDAEELVRGPRGYCQRVGPREPGLLLGKISARNEFIGYTDREASEKKILRDVFKKGDAWFDTGDLLERDRLGHLYFVDRLGDTFRWKGENVSTAEVAGSLATLDGIAEAVVYGVVVPGTEGRAGMAGLVLTAPFDGARLYAAIGSALPGYAQPRFLRVADQVAVTHTFKHAKNDAKREGFDPAAVGSDALYIRDPRARAYVELTPERLEAVRQRAWPL